MVRTCLLGALAAMLGCASQPICPPWSPTPPTRGPTTTTDVPSPTAQSASSSNDDGTVFLSGPSNEEEWTSVVGKAPPARATSAPPSRTVAAPPITKKPAAASAKPASGKAKPALALAAKPAAAATTKPVPTNHADGALRAEARAVYAGRCVPCHGASGRGDGPAGGALTPHPRNFTDKAWQATVNATYIEKVISNGGPAVGKSPLMPAQADLANNPGLLHALALYIQDFGK
jgi:mono/diheme cytochrome c family protein